MSFDIFSTPPSAEALATAARETETRIGAARRGMFLAVACVALAAVFGIIFDIVDALAFAVVCVPAGWVAMDVVMTRKERGAMPIAEKLLVVATAVVVVAMVAGLTVHMAATLGATSAVVAMVVAMVAGLAGLAWAKHARYRLRSLRSDLTAFDLIEPTACPDVVTWCGLHPAIASYQAQVATMGRFLVGGEVAAMRAWIAGIADVAQREQRVADETRQQTLQQAACMRLKTPVAVG